MSGRRLPAPRSGTLPPQLPSSARLKAALLRWGRLRRTGSGRLGETGLVDWGGASERWRRGLILTPGSDCVTLSKSLQPLDLWHLSGDYSSGLRGKGTGPGMCPIKPRAPGGVGPGPSPAGAVVGAAKP